MEPQKLVVDIPANEWLSANDRYHAYARSRRVAALRRRAFMLARSQRMRREQGKVLIEAAIHGRAPRRSDPANAADTTKPLVDGLRDAGVLVDDDHVHVVGPNHHYGDPIKMLPKGWHRIVLHLIPIEGEYR